MTGFIIAVLSAGVQAGFEHWLMNTDKVTYNSTVEIIQAIKRRIMAKRE